MKQVIELNVNGVRHEVAVAAQDLLIDVLRESLGLTGTKKGCGEGDCCSCSVLIDGQLALSCITLAIACQHKEIITIEGIEGKGGTLHPIQQAYIDKGAVQCGFCTPGMIIATKALLDENPNPTKDQIKRGLSGNLCRCTGYIKIVEAVEEAAQQLQKSSGQ
jgi:aerobic carbon-monoxide dehydrogenase small subunit